MAFAEVVQINGSLLEGGGQILRNATALSAITGKSIQVDKIRAGRKNPGLSPQHLTGLQLVSGITQGTLEGGSIRSTCISFTPGPGPPRTGNFTADTKTAGSCTLLVQQALPVLMFADAAIGSSLQDRPSKRSKPGASSSSDGSGVSTGGSSSSSSLTLKGGTDAAFAPPIGYLQHVFLPTLRRLIAPLGQELSLNLIKRGFYPKGGGEVQLLVPALSQNTPLPAWDITQRGYLIRITGYAVTAGKLRPDIGQRMANSASHSLRAVLKDEEVLFGGGSTQPSSSGVCGTSGTADAAASNAQQQRTSTPGSQLSADSIPSVVVDVQVIHEPQERAVGDGGSIVLVAETSTGCLLGASALAERGVSAEAVGAMAARDLLEELRSGAAVDSWLQDQLIIFMALAHGQSSMLCSELTLHTRTAISIAEQLLPDAQFSVSTVPMAAPAAHTDAGAAAASVSAGSSSGTGGPRAKLLYRVSCKGAGSTRRQRSLCPPVTQSAA